MGVYIKGIKKPKYCSECTVGECRIRLPKGDINYNVHPQCPLIEVKEPHGRLIDEDALCYEVVKKGGVDFIYTATSCIKDTPTVIEAEGK